MVLVDPGVAIATVFLGLGGGLIGRAKTVLGKGRRCLEMDIPSTNTQARTLGEEAEELEHKDGQLAQKHRSTDTNGQRPITLDRSII